MAIKKFFLTFTVVMLVFLMGAGIALIQVINNAEAKAIAKAQEAAEGGFDLPDTAIDGPGNIFETYVTKPMNVLVLVKDEVGANTDAILLVNFNTYDNKISMMWIPRDLMLTRDINKDGDFDNDIINMVYANSGLDIDKTIKVFEDEIGCNIKYGAVMTLKVFRELIDELGRVTFEVPYRMLYNDPYQDLHINFQPGVYQFNGEDAEKLLRFRKNDPGVESDYVNGSDLQRIKMQQDFMKAVIEQKSNLFFIAKLRDIINLIFDNLNTNASINDIIDFLPEVLKADLSAISMLSLPVTDTTDHIHLLAVEDELDEMITEYFKAPAN
ncbi:MAG: LCP family protein [Clostridia bacterium]|nr:LCP family protein [Clostridia bacterium]